MTKKIAVFIPSLSGGGAERAMIAFAEGAIELGYQVDLLIVKRQGPLLDAIPQNVNLIDLKCSRTLTSVFKLARYLRKQKPLALFSTIPHANLAALFARMLAGLDIPVILRESNSPVSEAKRSRARRIVHSLVPYFYPYAKGVIAVSNGVEAELRQMHKNNPALNVKVLPTPVVTASMLKDAEENISHPWFDQTVPLIVACGRLVPAKGFDVLLQAVSLIKKKKDVHLIILGEGSSRSELENLQASLGLKDCVSMPGYFLNPFPYLKKADVFVLSSRFEGMPNVLLQALSFGTPIVSTDCESGPRECLENGRLGKLVPVDNIAELADAITETLDNVKSKSSANEINSQIKDRYSSVSAAKNYLEFAGLSV